MKKIKYTLLSTATMLISYISTVQAQYSFGGDSVQSTIDRTTQWLQYTAIGIISIYLIFNFIKLARDDEDAHKAKKNIFGGFVALGLVMLLKGLISLVQQLTGGGLGF